MKSTPAHSRTRLSIGVRLLVEHMLRSGDLVFGAFGAAQTLEAVRAHQRLQKSRPAEYQSEVFVRGRVKHDDFVLEVTGRADGVFDYPDTTIVEEIKTTRRELPEETGDKNAAHWGQLKVYGHLLAKQKDRKAVTLRLTYVHLETQKTREFDETHSAEDLADFFSKLARGYLEWAKKLIQWRQMRDDSLSSLDFPFSTFRPGQRDMAVAVFRAVRDRKRLLLEAPTGIGKTAGALFPAVKALGQGCVDKIFYLTARTTGRLAAQNCLEKMRKTGLRLKSLTLFAKEKLCVCPGEVCGPDVCPMARGHFDRVNQALESLFDHDAFTRETVEQIAGFHRVCPFEFSLDLSLYADCVICDYNYAFDPRVYLRRFFAESSDPYLFLVDEAHNLVDRSREMFSAELCKSRVSELHRAVKKDLPAMGRSLGKIRAAFQTLGEKCQDNGETSQSLAPESLDSLLRRFVSRAEKWLAADRPADFRQDLALFYFEANAFLRVLELYDDTYATCLYARDEEVIVRLFCMDPSAQLGQALDRGAAAVFFSATLTPADYFQRLLGMKPDDPKMRLASPFPVANLALALAGGVTTLYGARSRTKDEVAGLILAMIQAKQGNYLVYFPSFAYLEMVRPLVEAGAGFAQIICQKPGMTEKERETYLSRFSEVSDTTLVGLAVMGGIFGEGIDLKGERLSGAAIVGVGLPGICLERDLIRDYFKAGGKDGFDFAYRFPGFTRVLQAAGRVIRSDTDIGCVLLLDRRFTAPAYNRLFPAHWRPFFVGNRTAVEQALKRFWEKPAV